MNQRIRNLLRTGTYVFAGILAYVVLLPYVILKAPIHLASAIIRDSRKLRARDELREAYDTAIREAKNHPNIRVIVHDDEFPN